MFETDCKQGVKPYRRADAASLGESAVRRTEVEAFCGPWI